MPAVNDYDLIIIDEAHRGYLLDKEMGDTELLYRDQRDYQSKYRSVIEYFDAVENCSDRYPCPPDHRDFRPASFQIHLPGSGHRGVSGGSRRPLTTFTPNCGMRASTINLAIQSPSMTR